MEGWICLHRRIIDWEWYSDPYVKTVFLHLLLTANHEPKRWKGKVIYAGQLITSAQHLADILHIDRKTVFNALRSLQDTNEISVLSRKGRYGYLCITVNNYRVYQSNKVENGTIGGIIDGTIGGTNDGHNITSKQYNNNISNDNNNACARLPVMDTKMLPTAELLEIMAGPQNAEQINGIAMKFDGWTSEQVRALLPEFGQTMTAKGMSGNTLRDARNHFFSWFIDYIKRRQYTARNQQSNTLHFTGEKQIKLNICNE